MTRVSAKIMKAAKGFNWLMYDAYRGSPNSLTTIKAYAIKLPCLRDANLLSRSYVY